MEGTEGMNRSSGGRCGVLREREDEKKGSKKGRKKKELGKEWI